jgi:adenylate cyclase
MYHNLLKDFFADITHPIIENKGEIYQYVGDEIVLSWSFKDGLKNKNVIQCCFLMREILEKLKSTYIERYGVYPEFRAGLHGGQVIVTWIGELKKEIVYIGDVVNTTARIREDCKRLEKDILISQDLLNSIEDLSGIKAVFVEETIPRGKAKSVRLYSLEEEVK